MLVASVADRRSTKPRASKTACELVWAHPQVRAELLGLLEVLADGVSHVQHGLSTHPDVPLRVHARYSRLEILAAFGIGDRAKVAPWQAGVYWARDVKADLFAFTLDKTSGQFSPTTRYRDYAISRELIHWESQSVTRADSETGGGTRHTKPWVIGDALCQAPRRRPRLLVPRAGDLRLTRIRAADGDHLAAQASAPGRPLCAVRGRGRVVGALQAPPSI